MRTLRAEWAALTSTRALAGHAAAALLLGLLPLVILPAVSSQGDAAGVPAFDTAEGQAAFLASASTGFLIAAILGAIVATRRHRHRTIVPQLLVEPSRVRAVLAQTVVVALGGALLAFLLAVVTLAATTAGLAIIGESLVVPGQDVVRVVAVAAYAGAVGGVIGAGVGALLRNSGAAIAVVVVLFLLVENLVAAFLPDVGQWLPATLLARLEQGADAPFVAGDVAPLAAGLALLGYVAALVAAAIAATTRRDAV